MSHAADLALPLIRHFEGFKSRAYRDPVGIWTIGYGTTRWTDGTPVRQGETVNESEAAALLWEWLADAERALKPALRVPINDHQMAALLSFAYNVGLSAVRNSTLLKRINEGKAIAASSEFLKWVKATDKKTGARVILPGLVRRRDAERKLFLGEDWQ